MVDELPWLQGGINQILATSDGGYIFAGHRSIADLYDPAFRDLQTVYGFAAGYSANSIANNLTQLDWLVDLESQGRNINVTDAQFLPDGTIGIVGTTAWGHDGSSWLGGITADGTQTYNELFAGVDARHGYFVDQAGDIRTWQPLGVNGTNSGTYTIDIGSTSSPPSSGGTTGGSSTSSGSSGGTADVPGPLPVLGLAAAFGLSRKLRKRIKLHRGTSAVSTPPGA